MKSTKSSPGQPLAIILFVLTFSLISCQKDNSVSVEPTEEESISMSQDNAAAEAEYEDVSEIGFSLDADLEASANANGEIGGDANDGGVSLNTHVFADLSFKAGACTKITVFPNDSTWPKTITIDYGTGCLCRDGKFRKGAIVLHYTKPIRRPGAVLTIKLRNYSVNRVQIEGTKIIRNLSEGHVLKYSVTVEGGKITWPNGRGFKYAKNKVVTQVRGMDTRTVRDDVFSIEGRAWISYANGVKINLNTETPLIKPVACNWIVKGILKIKINNRELFLDYGNGECDNKASLSWSGGVKDVVLP